MKSDAGVTLTKRKPFVKVYPGYGHSGSLVVYGHVFRKEPSIFKRLNNGLLSNFIQLLKLFFVRPVANAKLVLRFYGQVIEGTSEYDGFYRFDWKPGRDLEAGWHKLHVDYVDHAGAVLSSNEGRVMVPHVTQFAFISDIDDTVMRSYSATVLKRLYELLARNPGKRRIFIETVNHYKLLSLAHTTADMLNPMFYVSSSEWNLFDYLRQIFTHNQLPEGIFLLNQIKRWYQLLTSGRTGHDGKLMRISRILQAFPRQRFVLLGDNSQRDPLIYKAIADKHPEQIFAVYIRNVRDSRQDATLVLLDALEAKGIHTCIFEHSSEAIAHGKSINLIDIP